MEKLKLEDELKRQRAGGVPCWILYDNDLTRPVTAHNLNFLRVARYSDMSAPLPVLDEPFSFPARPFHTDGSRESAHMLRSFGFFKGPLTQQ